MRDMAKTTTADRREKMGSNLQRALHGRIKGQLGASKGEKFLVGMPRN